jgi:hypothetical protein
LLADAGDCPVEGGIELHLVPQHLKSCGDVLVSRLAKFLDAEPIALRQETTDRDEVSAMREVRRRDHVQNEAFDKALRGFFPIGIPSVARKSQPRLRNRASGQEI